MGHLSQYGNIRYNMDGVLNNNGSSNNNNNSLMEGLGLAGKRMLRPTALNIATTNGDGGARFIAPNNNVEVHVPLLTSNLNSESTQWPASFLSSPKQADGSDMFGGWDEINDFNSNSGVGSGYMNNATAKNDEYSEFNKERISKSNRNTTSTRPKSSSGIRRKKKKRRPKSAGVRRSRIR